MAEVTAAHELHDEEQSRFALQSVLQSSDEGMVGSSHDLALPDLVSETFDLVILRSEKLLIQSDENRLVGVVPSEWRLGEDTGS